MDCLLYIMTSGGEPIGYGWTVDREADPVVYTLFAQYTGANIEPPAGFYLTQVTGEDPCDVLNDANQEADSYYAGL